MEHKSTVTFYVCVTIDGVRIEYRIYWHQPKLQVITAPSLISKLYRLLQQTLSILQPAVSSTAVPCQRLLTLEILQLSALTSFLSVEYPATSPQPSLQSPTELPTLYTFHSSADLVSSLYGLGAEPTEETAPTVLLLLYSCLLNRCLYTAVN
jgi:hypothetical protein